MKVIDLIDEPQLGFHNLDDAKKGIAAFSEAQLQKMQGTLVDLISAQSGPTWTRELLDAVQSKILTIKLSRHVKVDAPKKAIAAADVNAVNGEVSRGGQGKTLVILKRLSGEFPESLLADPRLNFSIKAPLTQIASKKRSCMFALLPGESGQSLDGHVEYFKSRQRAGLAKIDGDVEVALIPPGPLARTLLGQDLLQGDPNLSQLAIGIIIQK